MTIPLASPSLARSSDLPGGPLDGPSSRHVAYAPLFGLAPCGVLPATPVARRAVRSYRTFSPLPFDSRSALASRSLRASRIDAHIGAQACLERAVGASRPRVERRYIFCATFLQVALTGRYPAHCPAEFGLSSLRLGSSSLARGKLRRLAVSEARRAESNGGHLARCEDPIVCYPSVSWLIAYCSSFL